MLEKAHDILRRVPLIDGHNDLPWQYRERAGNRLEAIDFAGGTAGLEPPMHTDLPRLRAGRVGAQFWSLYVPVELGGPGAARVMFEQIDVTLRLIERHGDDLELATCADDVERIFAAGKIASFLAIEGGHSIEDSLAVLRQAYAAGVRYMTLTHNNNVAWADSATDKPAHGGLTAFGKEVIGEMNRLGMLVDLSHVAPATMNAALDTSVAPVVFSHSSARALCDHPRNVPDDVLERVRDNDGVVMVTFVPAFVAEANRHHWMLAQAEQRRLRDEAGKQDDEIDQLMEEWLVAHPAPKASLRQVADHLDHVRAVAGVDHLGIGSDFDGITQVPEGLEDVSCYPALIAELLERGWTEDDIVKLASGNLLRVLRAAEAVAAKLQEERAPSEASMADTDGATPGEGAASRERAAAS